MAMSYHIRGDNAAGESCIEKKSSAKSMRPDCPVSEEAFDQVMRLERTYMETRFRKMESCLDKRLHEMTSRLRTDIASELMQQVLVCESSVSKKMSANEDATEKRIQEAATAMKTDMVVLVARELEDHLREHNKAVADTRRQLDELEDNFSVHSKTVADSRRQLDDFVGYFQHSKTEWDVNIKELNELYRCQLQSHKHELENLNARVSRCQMAREGEEQKTLINKNQDQLSCLHNDLYELRESFETVEKTVEQTQMQVAEATEYKPLIDKSQEQLSCLSNELCEMRACLETIEKTVEQAQIQVEETSLQMQQKWKQKEDDPCPSHRELHNAEDAHRDACYDDRCSAIQLTIIELQQDLKILQDAHNSDFREMSAAHAKLKIDFNSLQVSLFAAGHQEDLKNSSEKLPGDLSRRTSLGENAYDLSSTHSHSLFSRLEEESRQSDLDPSNVIEAEETKVGTQCFDISDAIFGEVEADRLTLLQTSIEAMQGDLSRMDQDLISERLDRHRVLASVNGLSCEFHDFADTISQRISKLEAPSPVIKEDIPFRRAHEDIMESACTAFGRDVQKVGQGFTAEGVAVRNVIMHLESKEVYDIKATKDVEASVEAAHSLQEDAAQDAAVINTGSPCRRTRRGRQGHQMSSPMKTPPKSLSLGKDDQEPDEILRFLKEFGQ